MKLDNHHQSKKQKFVHVVTCHLLKKRSSMLARNPISVGIDPVRLLEAVAFCSIRNMLEVVSRQ